MDIGEEDWAFLKLLHNLVIVRNNQSVSAVSTSD
jgi:hypothetical protein